MNDPAPRPAPVLGLLRPPTVRRDRLSVVGTRQVTVDGPSFRQGDRPFHFRGVTYGTFSPDEGGDLYPPRCRVERDFAAMRKNGFTVVRTYTVPPDHVLETAVEHDLQLLVGVFWKDWRYMVGAGRRQRRQIEVDAERSVRQAAEHLAGHEHVLGLCLANEVPADVIRWLGTTTVSRSISRLARTVRDADPERLVTYGNYPTSEYLAVEDLDFLTFNVFLESPLDLRRYLTRLHHLAAGRPLVLGEIGSHAAAGPDGEARQAEAIDWQLETAVERGVAGVCVFSWTDDWWVGGTPVEGWRFGLTRADRSPRPALDAARRWNHRTVADLGFPWPSVTVVVCAFNAGATLDECLRHLCALDYPQLEIIVVDDGSTDDTAAIARRHPRVRLLSIPHAGLSAARNEGYRAATGELVAYLDSDAYPSPEWLHYLALGMDGRQVGGVGGPNLPPASDPAGAHRVALAPGGPAHVLFSDDRAEHVPGCNMAFWRKVLAEVGGFDPVFTSAGDDVDLCWRVLELGWEIGFHPAAFVWHHPRATVRGYLRQQRGYGRSEALVETRHPDRFTQTGTARWHGSIYGGGRPFTPRFSRQRIYQGTYGSAAYQSVYRAGGHAIDLAHWLGVPLASVLVAGAPLALVLPYFGIVSGFGCLVLVVLGCLDMLRCNAPGGPRHARTTFKLGVALLHLLQPLARAGGRYGRGAPVRPAAAPPRPLPPTAHRIGRNVVLLREDRDRTELVSLLVDRLRGAGVHVAPATGWESYDARTSCSALLTGRLITSNHPPGWVQARFRARPRWLAIALFATTVAVLACVAPVLAGALTAAAVVETWHGRRRLARTFLRTLSVMSS